MNFGRSKTLQEGFVVQLKENSTFEVKPIQSVQKEYGLRPENIELARLMANKYFCNISDCIKLMLPPGTSSKITQNRTKEKCMNFVYLKKEPEEIEEDIDKKIIKSEKQIRVLQFLMENDGILTTELELYTDTTHAVIKTLEKNGYIEIIEKQVQRNPFVNKEIIPTTKLELTQEQQIAYDKINGCIQKSEYEQFLLYGVTGSGKTEVYLQLIQSAIEKDRKAIVLVPEISLTPQMVDRFIARFGQDKIAVLHSKLSLGERYDEWNRIKTNQAKIIIGARSAIFAPVTNIGIIIIDEEHDSSYKSEMNPRYQAKEIATFLSKQHKAPLVLGSATPDLGTFYQAQQNKIQLITLTKRANKSNMPSVELVDLRQELINGNRSMVSMRLYEEMEQNLKQKKQTILFLNRRGYSTFVMCRDCGYTAKCKNCNITLTYHLKQDKLKCHYCGYEQKNITKCPKCGGGNVRYFGTGTQKLEQEIQKMFPNATTIRMDVDTITKKNSHEEILTSFKEKGIDILIGTQMVVKGHHFPNVTLVGVIAADSSLNIEDYRANERTFQILTQVAGRAGRENLPGKVIIQTYNPDNFCIQLSKKQDYAEFYKTEIAIRKQLKYPPFCDIILIGMSSEKEKELEMVATKLQEKIKNIAKNNKIPIVISKPMPSPIDRIKNKYRWRIILKGKLNTTTIKLIKQGLMEIESTKVRIIVDTNPSNMS